jgi:hypothetical protein
MKKSNPTSPGGAEHTTTICGMLRNHRLDSLDHLAAIVCKQVVGWLASFSNWLNDTIPFFYQWVPGSMGVGHLTTWSKGKLVNE